MDQNNSPAVQLSPEEQMKITIEKKKDQWGKFGAKMYSTELKLQATAQQVLIKKKLPTVIGEVADAETYLKELKKTRESLVVERSVITGAFDAVKERLMKTEKSLDPVITEMTTAIITVKKADEVERRKKQQAADELIAAAKYAKSKAANFTAQCHQKITNKVSEVYVRALNESIDPGDIPAYLDRARLELNDYDFYLAPDMTRPNFAEKAAYDKVVQENCIVDKPDVFITMYNDALDEKFSDYDVAFHQAESAIALDAQQKENAHSEIVQQQQGALFSADFASQVEVVSTVKALRQSYEISMEADLNSSRTIMTAFFKYSQKTAPKVRVKDWFALSIKQAGAALAAVKSDDNSFTPEGVIFKIVDKL